ncbi:Uncharacterised protein [Candidatus Tiddalikarchaeum anstoanum]|nr:Uncharacterised protein [Candidatus Tiddalikarchaeum anstoanum]
MNTYSENVFDTPNIEKLVIEHFDPEEIDKMEVLLSWAKNTYPADFLKYVNEINSAYLGAKVTLNNIKKDKTLTDKYLQNGVELNLETTKDGFMFYLDDVSIKQIRSEISKSLETSLENLPDKEEKFARFIMPPLSNVMNKETVSAFKFLKELYLETCLNNIQVEDRSSIINQISKEYKILEHYKKNGSSPTLIIGRKDGKIFWNFEDYDIEKYGLRRSPEIVTQVKLTPSPITITYPKINIKQLKPLEDNENDVIIPPDFFD